MVNQFKGSAEAPPQFTRGYGLVFGQSRAQGDGDGAGRPGAARRASSARTSTAPAQDEEFVLSHSDNVQATGFVEHLKLPHYVDFQAELDLVRSCAPSRERDGRQRRRDAGGGGMNRTPAYNFAYLDEQTKRMIRRAILKAIAIPGYQVPFASREMPMPYGWGTGGVQVTAAIIGPDDVLKVIDQGADDTTNAVSIRNFFAKTAGVATTDRDRARRPSSRPATASPRRRSTSGQILVYQVPIPEPLRFLEPRETETRKMHALEEYGLMHVKLYEDIARHGHIATTYAYPVKVDGRYVMDPSPTPKFDNPKMRHVAGAAAVRRRPREAHLRGAALHASGAASTSRTIPSRCRRFDEPCALCGARDSFLDEVVTRRPRRPHVRLLRHRLLRRPARRRASRGGMDARHERATTTPLLRRRGPHQVLRRARRLPRRRRSSSGRARCWRWSANPAPASRRCCNCLSTQLRADRRHASRYRMRDGAIARPLAARARPSAAS